MKAKKILFTAATGLLSLAFCGCPAIAQDSKPAPAKQETHKKDKEAHKQEKQDKHHDDKHADKVDVGAAAPAFTAKDSEGKTHSLAELTKSGKVVVLAWFNPECPWVKKHFTGSTKTFNELDAKYKAKGVVLLAVSSNAAGN